VDKGPKNLSIAALLALLGAAPLTARADDWLVAYPSCGFGPEARGLGATAILYPTETLPAVIDAGSALVSRVRVPSGLTPPPGVQQDRALEKWAAELIGAGIELERHTPHRYVVRVVNVRPDGPSSLVYRATIAIPAWTAPGTYALRIRVPGGERTTERSVRVIEAGTRPVVALAGGDELPPTLEHAAVDAWITTARAAPRSSDPVHASTSSPVTLRLPPDRAVDVALRIGGELVVLGRCADPYVSLDELLRAVSVRERLRERSIARGDLPAQGALRLDSRASAPFPTEGARIDRQAGDLVIDVPRAATLGAQVDVVLPLDPRALSIARARATLWPATNVGAYARVHGLVASVRVDAGQRAVVRRAAAIASPLRLALRALPLRPEAGLEATVRGVSSRGVERLAWSLSPDDSITATGSEARHVWRAPGLYNVQAFAISADGATARAEMAVPVQVRRAHVCAAAAPGVPTRDCTPLGLIALLLAWKLARRRRQEYSAGGGWLSAMMRRTLGCVVVAWLAGVCAACTHDVIPNTDVPDTSENREVIKFVEKYRKAVERRDVGSLLAFASTRYFDDNGTPGAGDDVDFQGLRERLGRFHEAVLDVRYSIRYRRVTFESDRILVDFTFTGSFRLATAQGDRWARRLADNRLVLARERGDLKILSGM